MSAQHIEIFDEARVRALLPMPRVIAAMEEAFRAISSGKAQVPVRSGIALQDEDSRLLVMPASVAGWPFASVKIVSVCPQNRTRGIETINGVIEVFDRTAVAALTQPAAGDATRTVLWDLRADRELAALALPGFQW
jgi:ornithine cyclodeaminase/alanine dehydrogenase-like protein (mu-crystallin family)